MNIQETVKFLSSYYNRTRQVGHTTALMEGANNTDNPIILAVDTNHMGNLRNICKNRSACVARLESCDTVLRGVKSPILFDNYTLHTLFLDISEEFDRLQSIINNYAFDFRKSDQAFIERCIEITEREGRKEVEEKLEKIKEIIND